MATTSNQVTINQAILNGLKIGDRVQFPSGAIRYYRQNTLNFGRTMYRFTKSLTGIGASFDGDILVTVLD